jgi:hypothetical protein
VSVFKIEGELRLDTDIDHQELLKKFYSLLKSENIHFAGQTKKVDEKS